MSTPDCPSAASGDRCDRRQSCEGTYILTFQPNDGAPIAIKGTQAEGADLRLQTSKAGKGIRTLDIQLGKRGSQAVLMRESALRCSDRR
jgi:hypothetical protein